MSREADYFILHSDMGLLTHFTPPILFGLAYHDPVQWFGRIPHWVHYPPASMGIDIMPSALWTCSFWSLQPNHFTCGLHPSLVDTPVDVYGISHNFPFFHPREALLVGHQVTTLPLFSCSILFFITSDRGSLAWGGAGTPVPCMMAAHTQGNANLWHDEKKLVSVEDCDHLCWFVTSKEGTISHDLTHHLPSLFFPPILDLPLSLPGISLH